MMPSARQPARSRCPTPSRRPLKIGLALHSAAYSGSRFFISAMKSRIWSSAPGRHVLGDAAGPDERVVHPQPGDQLEQVEHQLALAEADRHHGQRADLHAAGGDRDEVAGDAVELHQEDPHDLRLLRDVVLDVQEPLHAEGVGRLVVERRQVVHPGAERDALHPGAELHVLLDAGVQVADAAAGLGDRLALELEDEPEHAVRGRVLRAHVDDDVVVALLGETVGDRVPVLAGDGEDPAGGGVGVRGVGVLLSGGWLVETISCTTSAGPAVGWWRPCTPPGCHRGGSPCAAGARASRRASGCASERDDRRR